MPLLRCDVGLVSELRLTAGCVLMDLVSPAVSETSVYASGLNLSKDIIVLCSKSNTKTKKNTLTFKNRASYI